MNERNSPAVSANSVLIFLFFADLLAWTWEGSTIFETYPWLVTGDIGGPAMLKLCGLSVLPTVLVWGVVVLCDRTERATKLLGFWSALITLFVASAIVLLLVLPYSLTGGRVPYSVFPQSFPPYSWGEVGSIMQWLALNFVFPYGPYLGYFSLAVLVFDLICRSHLFPMRFRVTGWVIVIGCGTLSFAILSLWTANLVWFY